jgi:diguanylate cyclase
MTVQPDEILGKLAATITDSNDLEQLVRPFLELLEEVTGLESTYLTRIDRAEGLQHILFARNTRAQKFEIPEGLAVPWEDTLCKRALDEQRPYSDDVAGCWGDSQAAKALGIRTYLSEPIRVGEGQLYGTLCGASGSSISVSIEARRMLSMLARIIARQLERDFLMEKLERENLSLSQQALLDPLTGLPNRRALMQELERALAGSQRTGTPLFVAFIDLDGFKSINDQYGHDAGDRFLIQFAQKLKEGLRDADFFSRHGGDEFVAFGPATTSDLDEDRILFGQRLRQLTAGTFLLNEQEYFYPGASVGVVTSEADEKDKEALIARADAAMYRIKQSRRINH